nr:MAG TPA: hypothetical protein [Caudoviricetes sp.]
MVQHMCLCTIYKMPLTNSYCAKLSITLQNLFY